jgi:hypothetical protein
VEVDRGRPCALLLGRVERMEHERNRRQQRESCEERAHLVGHRQEEAADRVEDEQGAEDERHGTGEDEVAAVRDRARDGVRHGAERQLLQPGHGRAGPAHLREERRGREDAGDRAVAEVVHDRRLVEEPGRDQVGEAEAGQPEAERRGERERAHGGGTVHSATQSSVSTSQKARPAYGP